MGFSALHALACVLASPLLLLSVAPSMAQSVDTQTWLAAGIEAYDPFKYDEAARILKPLADARSVETHTIMALAHEKGIGIRNIRDIGKVSYDTGFSREYVVRTADGGDCLASLRTSSSRHEAPTMWFEREV